MVRNFINKKAISFEIAHPRKGPISTTTSFRYPERAKHPNQNLRNRG